MRWLAATALMILTAAPAANAEPALHATFDVSGTAVFNGSSTGDAQWVGSIRDARLNHDPAQDTLTCAGQGRLLEYRYAVAHADEGTPTGYVQRERLIDANESSLGLVAGAVVMEAAGPHHSLRLLPASPRSIPIAGDFSLGPAVDLEEVTRITPDAEPQDARRGHFPAMGGVLTTTLEVESFQGLLIVSDYVVKFPDSTIDARWSSSPSPVLPFAASVKTTRILIIDGTCHPSAPLQADNWHHSIQTLTADLDGDLALSNAQGTGSLNGSALPSGIHLFQAHGILAAGADYSRPSSHWVIDGRPRFVAVNANAVLGSRDGLTAIAVAGTAALLLAASAKWGRILVTLLPGLNIAKPLGNPQRKQVLTIIAQQPGIDQAFLVNRLSLGRGTIRHHLRILLRSDLLTERRVSGKNTYTLNSSSFDFPTSAGSELSAGVAFALTGTSHRRSIMQILNEARACGTEEIRRTLELAGAPLSRAALTYHLRTMQKAGLVERQRSGREAVWVAKVRLQELLPTQRQRFLDTAKLQDVFGVLGPQPLPASEIVRTLTASGKRRSIPQTVADLELLVATGFAHRRDLGFVRVN